MAVSERVLPVLIGILLVSKCDADLNPVGSGLEEGLAQNVLMPNERESLDDCHLRFYHEGGRGIVGPAFAKPAFLTEFAHIAAIGWSRADGQVDWSCGGSLIWNNFILTAAHCASNDELSIDIATELWPSVVLINIAPDVVRMGDLNLFSAEDDAHAQQLKIVKIFRHPQHTYSAKYYDIALLQLEHNVTIHETVAPSCLWLDAEVRFRDLESAGWGQTGFAEERTPILLKVSLNPLRNEHCSEHYTPANVRGLRQGLNSHQLCAGDAQMDTCLGDSGGPLHVRLLHNYKVTPFLVGVTSFGKPCGQSHPGVYTRVSSFRRWIVETMQSNGAPEVSDEQFEPYACALRYVHIRQLAVSRVVANESGVFESFDFTRQYMTREFVKEAVELRWRNESSSAPSNCMGVIIDRDTIVTLGDCASHEGVPPTQVVHRIRTGYMEDDFAERPYEVKEVMVHPNHTASSYYDNLAVVKIRGAFGYTPACIWNTLRLPDREMEITTVGRRDLNVYQYQSVTDYDSRLVRLVPRVYGFENDNCRLADEYRRNLSNGLQTEHLCFGNDPFLVPETCDLTNGGPLQRSLFRLGRHFKHVYALSLFGRDCGYGEPAVAVRLHPHLHWLESVLLPGQQKRTSADETDATKSDSIVFIDSELELFDRCDFRDGTVGLCVPAERCRGVYDRMQRHEASLFCTNGSIVCCTPRNVMDDSDLRYGVGEIESCPGNYGDLREHLASLPTKERPKTHIVEIGWFDAKKDTGAIVCLGYLITTQAVLTTAECMTMPGPGEPNFVRLGAIFGEFEDSTKLTAIDEIITHPRYEQRTNANNIALLKLPDYMRPTKAVFPGCLWSNATHTPLESTLFSKDVTGVLERTVHPQYDSDCERALGGGLSDGQMCMVTTEGAVCGHSGDPVFWSEQTGDGSASVEYLVGLYSHANCTQGSPGVMVRISAYRKWILDVFHTVIMVRHSVLLAAAATAVATVLIAECSAHLFPAKPMVPGDEEGMMLPYDRIALDDCHMRFWKAGNRGLVAPAYGQPALLREFAHIAAIGWTRSDGQIDWNCGGSLIWENFILTAAHCAVDDEDIAPDVARFGDLNIYSDEDDDYAQQLRIVEVIRHPQHRYSARYYDVALMRLERNITVHETVAPTCLWLDDEIRFPALLSAGWGRTGFAEDKTRILLKVSLTPISNAECSRLYTSAERGLRNGLHAHHLCAGDQLMDTCPGDSGGPLHVKLLHNAKISPFLVGVTSFGKPCGQSNPGVYARVSQFGDWIMETLQQHDRFITPDMFEPWSCALRYVHVREYEEDVVVSRSRNYETYNSDNAHLEAGDSPQRVRIWWADRLQPRRTNCSGVLFEPDAVLTLAECASHMGVILSNSNYMEVKETIIHPEYLGGIEPYYNNIALLKLKGKVSSITPLCGWYRDEPPEPQFEVLGVGRADLTPYNRDEVVKELDPRQISLNPRATYKPNSECQLAPQYRSKLARGLQREHLCFQNVPFVVPGTCQQQLGGPVEREMWRFERYFNYFYGINLLGRDCGFGEPALAVRLNGHKAWLESLLLPKRPANAGQQPSDSVIFINPDLSLSDRCTYTDGTMGVCVAQSDCPGIRQRMQANKPVILCSSGSVVCCPSVDIRPPPSAIEREFNECEQRYQHLRKQRQQRWEGFQPVERRLSHVAEVGWQGVNEISFLCIGYLISTRAVVAAASCLVSNEYHPSIVRLGGMWAHDKPDIAIIRIEQHEIHPGFNQTTFLHNIALLVLATPVQPTVTMFPGCVWQNVTHTPVELEIPASGRFEPIHPMYRSDCDERYVRPFVNQEQICMVPGVSGPGTYCYAPGSPIVWQKMADKNLFTEYLVNLYSHGNCNSTNLRIVHRISMYIDWFKQVLG
uniref:Peptidase S1 domain-containing protein n=1 Tax=Anopheles albimanus TaxID=7167 RepID=A0A182FUI2_ANOAL